MLQPGRLDRGEDTGSIKALPFPEVSSSSAFLNSMASETMLRDEKLEDAAAALSAASKKVAPFLRGNMRKPVAASDASGRVAAATISPEGRPWQESSRRESLGFPGPLPQQEYVQDVRNEMRNGPMMGLVSPNGQHPFRPGLLGPDTRLPTPEQELPFSASTGPQASSFPMQAYERDLRAVGPMAPTPVSPPAVQSQRGRISQRVQGALRAHAALHSEGTVPVATPSTAPAGGTLPMPAMVNGASEHGQLLRQAKEVIASLDTCGDPTVMERWMHHLEESAHPMKEAEKIMGMLRSLVRQGFCAGTADQAMQKRSQVMRGPVPPRLQDVPESSGQWPTLQTSSPHGPTMQTSSPHGPTMQTSSPHGSLSRGILATAPNTQAGRDGQIAGAAQAQRNMHAIARNLVDKGLLDPRSIPNGLSEIPANDVDMLSMLRHLKEVGESSRTHRRHMEFVLY
eukprot:s1298_g7.t1